MQVKIKTQYLACLFVYLGQEVALYSLPEKNPLQLAMFIKMKSLNSPLHRHRRLMVYEALAKSGLNVLMSERIGSFYEECNIMSSFF